MRLGLVTDVHNHAAELAVALALFRERGVEQVVTIGDTWDPFGGTGGSTEVAALLRDCEAVGVWGNHDFTLCHNVSARVRDMYPPDALAVMTRMQPRLTIGPCHFSHKEASVDPYDLFQLWDVSDRPQGLPSRAAEAFAVCRTPWQFVGHYHRWWAATPAGPLDWAGERTLRFAPGRRYFVVVAAVCDGWCAVLDTDRAELEPLRCEVEERACPAG